MKDKTQVSKKLTTQIKQWDTKINELTTEMKKANPDSRLGLQEQIDVLRTNQVVTQIKLTQLLKNQNVTWDKIKPVFEKPWLNPNLRFRGVQRSTINGKPIKQHQIFRKSNER